MGSSSAGIAQAFQTSAGKRLLLVNKRNRPATLAVKTDGSPFTVAVVDSQSAGQEPRTEVIRDGRITLAPFAVAVAKFD